ncbi:hypothetical protein H4W31_002758 [Plantactinospora soyae]|uniref:Uncharacterized protein n=1 Tax=Plantactinospora soyae TaxID=1544732 RepID=A0A927M9T3_9ACTN|nr:hypothetical protein [Plantactinospora soyae]
MAHLASGGFQAVQEGYESDVGDERELEVTTVERYLTTRPWALTAVLAPVSEVGCILAEAAPQHSQSHQVLTQTELVQVQASAQRQGTNGFTGNGIPVGVKRMDVSGVPPRGRPV